MRELEKGLPCSYALKDEEYSLQGYDYRKVRVHAVCPNMHCRKDITHILEPTMETLYCPSCGQKISLKNEPQYPMNIEIEMYRGDDGEWYAGNRDLKIW